MAAPYRKLCLLVAHIVLKVMNSLDALAVALMPHKNYTWRCLHLNGMSEVQYDSLQKTANRSLNIEDEGHVSLLLMRRSRSTSHLLY